MRQFTIAANQCATGLNRGLSKFLVAEKHKLCKIYGKIHVYREACFSKKKLYKQAKYGFAIINLSQRECLLKKKFWMQWSVKKVMLIVFWDITVDFLEKGATVNSASYCQLLKQISPYLLNDHCIT